MRFDLGAHHAQYPAGDDTRVIAVEAREPESDQAGLATTAFDGHRNILDVSRGPARRGEQNRRMLRQLVRLSLHRGVDIGLKVLVARDGNPSLEFFKGGNAAEAMASPELGVRIGRQDFAQQPILRLRGGGAGGAKPLQRRPRGRPEHYIPYKRHPTLPSRTLRDTGLADRPLQELCLVGADTQPRTPGTGRRPTPVTKLNRWRDGVVPQEVPSEAAFGVSDG